MKVNRKKRRTRSAFGSLSGVQAGFEKQNMSVGHTIGVVEKIVQGTTKPKTEGGKGKPFIALRFHVAHAFDDGEKFYAPGAEKPTAFLQIGANPADVLVENEWGYHLKSWKNFLMTVLELTDEQVGEQAEALLEAVKAGELPEALEQYADYVDDVEDLESASEVIWEQATDYATGDDQPLAGCLVEWNTTSKLKKDARDKPADQVKMDDIVFNTFYTGAPSYTELAKLLDEDGHDRVLRFLPDLMDRIAADKAE